MNQMPAKPSRGTTKRLIIINMALAWLAFLWSIHAQVIEATAMPLMTLIIGLFGLYTGTGHLDLRAMSQVLTRKDEGGQGNDWPS